MPLRCAITVRSWDTCSEKSGYPWRSVLVVCVLFGIKLAGQDLTDTLELRPFEVIAPRLSQFSAGTKLQAMDSATMAQHRLLNLGDLLASRSPVFVKSYGLGSLATTSFRGGSAYHTAILWNGFNIGSPMNGQLDLSLVPMAAVGDVSIQYGGTSALWGSGAIGGAIHLSSTPRFGRGLLVDAALGAGSYGDLRQQARIEFSGERSITSIALFNADARNDLRYTVRQGAGTEERQQTNAALHQQGFIAEQHYRINAQQRLNARVWYQRTTREIPPSRLQPTSTAQQDDATLRATAEWSRTAEKLNLAVRGAYFDEQLDWFAATDEPVVPSRSRTLIAEAEMRIRLAPRHTAEVGVNNTYTEATTEGYPDKPRQDRAALFGAYLFQSTNGRTVASLSARQELLDGDPMPLTASIGAEHGLASWLKMKAQGARVYRVPTFNELYWRPGGDPGLQPEHGYSGDAGLVVQRRKGRFGFRSEVTAFSRSITNWIIWLPGPSYWTPRNVLEVWSRGVETDSELAWQFLRSTIKLGVVTNHVVSTNEVPSGVNDASVDKQLIYVPMYSGQARLALEHGKLVLNISALYTGYRYTSTDNRAYLEPYWICNSYASYRLVGRSRWWATVFVSANNLFDADYEVMLNRPMPLRNYQAGISFHFEKPNKQKE